MNPGTANPKSEAIEAVNILIVDDKPENLTALEAVLSRPGYRLLKARSGRQALRLLLADDVAVVLLDILMPDMNGFETAALIRHREKNRDVPIIFLTAEYQGFEHVSKGYELKAVDYIIKPFNPEILHAKVAVLVELHRKTVQLEESNRQLIAEIAERKRIEQDLSHRLAQQGKEIQSLEKLAAAPGTSITAQQYSQGPLRETVPEVFQDLVRIYDDLLNLALDQRAYRVEHDVTSKLRAMAEQLGFLNAKPRDLVEIHSTSLKSKIKGAAPRKIQAYMAEARIMILEAMGYLADYYRDRY